MKVLYLSRWYPCRNDPMPGLFVQRQAEAVSEHCDISVLYVAEDKRPSGGFETVWSEEKKVRVIRVYYQPLAGFPGIVNRAVNAFRFLKAHWIGYRSLKSEKFDLVHVHVLTREAFIAFIIKLKTKTPFVITEHWSRYFPQNGTYTGILRRWMTRRMIRSSSALVAVSEKLKSAMQDQHLDHRDFRVIPNPVDMDLFSPGVREHETSPAGIRIIHVSCFEDKSKNISGFLRVLHRISRIRDDFVCSLIGDGPDREMIFQMIKDLDLSKVVHCPGLQSGEGLISAIRNADFLVLSSHYETFGSVIIESLACGTPVVSTDTGIAGRVISRENGLIVPPSDDLALENAIVRMMDECLKNFDRTKIRESIGQAFSNKTIGDQLYGLYKNVLRLS